MTSGLINWYGRNIALSGSLIMMGCQDSVNYIRRYPLKCYQWQLLNYLGRKGSATTYFVSLSFSLFMAALWNRAGHYIFALWFLLSSFFLLSFFLALSQRLEIGCLSYIHTWCGLSANLECTSEMCCTRLAGNAGPKNIAKKSPSAHHSTTLLGYIFATKAHIDNRKNC